MDTHVGHELCNDYIVRIFFYYLNWKVQSTLNIHTHKNLYLWTGLSIWHSFFRVMIVIPTVSFFVTSDCLLSLVLFVFDLRNPPCFMNNSPCHQIISESSIGHSPVSVSVQIALSFSSGHQESVKTRSNVCEVKTQTFGGGGAIC